MAKTKKQLEREAKKRIKKGRIFCEKNKKILSMKVDDMIEAHRRYDKIKGFEKVARDPKIDAWRIRCQHQLKNGNQCSLFAKGKGLFCEGHKAGYKSKGKETRGRKEQTDLAKQHETALGIYGKRESTLLREELEKVDQIPEDELLDVVRDVKVSEAIIEKLLNQKLKRYGRGDKYSGRKIKTQQEADEINDKIKSKAVKSLQYAIMNNTNIKKMFYDIKFSDANMVSKDLFKYVVNMFNQIIIEEVKDITVIEKIKDRIRKLGLDIQSGNVPGVK